jgi:uncharacterized protein
MLRNSLISLKKLLVTALLCVAGQASAGSYEDFFKAIQFDDADTVKGLLARGFDPNTRSPQNQHGLYLALREPSLKVAQVLLQAPKIDVNALNTQNESPLMMAALKGQVQVAQELIAKDADINKTGWTPLHYAATTGQVQIIRLLLDKHAYIDAESPNKTTPLMMAAHYGTPGAVKLLLEEGADASLKNDQDLSAIDFAQRGNKQESVDIISAFIRAKQPKGKW